MDNRELLEGDVSKFLDAEAVGLVKTYFSAKFTGNRFHQLGGGGAASDVADRFTSDDVVAVSLLDVNIPGSAALEMLVHRAEQLNSILSEVPRDVDLHSASDADIGTGSAADRLWTSLVAIPEIGWVSASKLMARKRPRLIPIYDSVLKAALLPGSGNYWIALRNELQDVELRNKLTSIRATAGVDPSIPIIRILDVCVWMRNWSGSELAKRLPFTPRKQGEN
jgi:Family of unknown function (DUF6308)